MFMLLGKARLSAAGVATVLGVLASTAPAHATTAVWSCGADAVTATVAGQSPLNPVTVSSAPCTDKTAGLPNATDALSLAPAVNAHTAYAISAVRPPDGRPIAQAIGSAAGVEGLSLEAAGNVAIGVDAARSEASAACDASGVTTTGSTDIVGLTLGGQKLSLDQPLITLTDGVSSLLGAIVTVKLDEQIKTPDGLIVRAAHIQVLPNAGAAPLADVVIAESRVSSASACDPNADNNKDGSGAGGTNGTVAGAATLKLCPDGSTLDATSGLCVITAASSGGQGIVVIGRPYSGPSGGKVLSLAVARKRYKSPCLSGPGAKYAIVGTQKNDRITGTNVADRILGRAGNDALDGGRGSDCLDGGTGGDTLSGALGNDRAYGLAGNDHLNGGPGNDYLSGGNGNDTINTSFGTDRVFGGAGVDFVNSATAGKPALINCGAGKDKVRINRNERRRTKGCETSYVFNDV